MPIFSHTVTGYLFALLATVALASVLPMTGAAAHGLDRFTDLAIAALFFLHGARLPRESIVAGMLHEITVRHIAFAMRENRPMSKADYDILMKSYRRLMTLMRSGNAAAAEAHWRKHLDVANSLLFAGILSRSLDRQHRLQPMDFGLLSRLALIVVFVATGSLLEPTQFMAALLPAIGLLAARGLLADLRRDGATTHLLLRRETLQ